MIDNSDFVASVKGKREKVQKFFVRACRVLNMLLPCRLVASEQKRAGYTYVTICSKRGLDMVAASLYSLFKNSSLHPSKIVVVSDGKWEPGYGVRYFRKRGLEVECLLWEQCADYYKDKLPELTVWASKHIWGKKMAAILYVSETDKVLFSDPDVLWYGDPLTVAELNSIRLKVSIDCCHSYDKQYIKDTNSEYLYDSDDPVNCGVVYIHGGLKMLNDKALECIRYQAEHCGNFAEQTVFAIMERQYDNRWSREEIVSAIDDVVQPLFSKTIMYPNTVARHYLWRLKWIYWTEYFKMRLSGKK
ncbi:MAG: hypothetical protein II295_00960 [Akkermansia sp.]|nr:hypothetical protein [Akkermansia sp.]